MGRSRKKSRNSFERVIRYRTRYAVNLYGCTGWVRNEWDASVTMQIQGTEENIDKVILTIERGSYVRTEDMDSRMIPLTGVRIQNRIM